MTFGGSKIEYIGDDSPKKRYLEKQDWLALEYIGDDSRKKRYLENIMEYEIINNK